MNRCSVSTAQPKTYVKVSLWVACLVSHSCPSYSQHLFSLLVRQSFTGIGLDSGVLVYRHCWIGYVSQNSFVIVWQTGLLAYLKYVEEDSGFLLHLHFRSY